MSLNNCWFFNDIDQNKIMYKTLLVSNIFIWYCHFQFVTSYKIYSFKTILIGSEENNTYHNVTFNLSMSELNDLMWTEWFFLHCMHCIFWPFKCPHWNLFVVINKVQMPISKKILFYCFVKTCVHTCICLYTRRVRFPRHKDF